MKFRHDLQSHAEPLPVALTKKGQHKNWVTVFKYVKCSPYDYSR